MIKQYFCNENKSKSNSDVDNTLKILASSLEMFSKSCYIFLDKINKQNIESRLQCTSIRSRAKGICFTNFKNCQPQLMPLVICYSSQMRTQEKMNSKGVYHPYTPYSQGNPSQVIFR